ncbi:hypothetical protein PVAP13_6NG093703, partial [Panicum virgatum]
SHLPLTQPKRGHPPPSPVRPPPPDPESTAGRRHPRGRATRWLPPAALRPQAASARLPPPAGAVRGHAAAANPARRSLPPPAVPAPARPPPRPFDPAPGCRSAAASTHAVGYRACPSAHPGSSH